MLSEVKLLKNKIFNMPTPAKATIAFVLCSFMQQGISVLTTPIFTRLLTTEQYGYYSIFNSWLNIISVFTTLKLAGGVFTQALIKFSDNREELTASTAGLGTTLTLLAIVIYIPFRHIINSLMTINTLTMLCILVASWTMLIFELWASKQRVEYRYKSLVGLTLFTSIAKPLFGIVAVLSTVQYKAEARIVSFVLIEFISYIGLFIIFIKRGKKFFNKYFWKYSLSLNVPLIPHYLARTVLNQCDRLMINVMIGYSSAGIYSLAYNLAWMLNIVAASILNAFNPWMYQRIKNKEYDSIGLLSYVLLALIGMCALSFISVAPEVIRIFAPAEYYDAIWIIPPVTTSVYFLFMYSLYANFEFYFEKSRFMMVASTIGGILNVILNYFCIKAFGYIAAGYTTLACYIFYAVAHYWCMKKIINSNLDGIKIYNMKIIVSISLLLLAASATMMFVYDKVIVRYSIIIIVYSVIWVKRRLIIGIIKQIKKSTRY